MISIGFHHSNCIRSSDQLAILPVASLGPMPTFQTTLPKALDFHTVLWFSRYLLPLDKKKRIVQHRITENLTKQQTSHLLLPTIKNTWTIFTRALVPIQNKSTRVQNNNKNTWSNSQTNSKQLPKFNNI